MRELALFGVLLCISIFSYGSDIDTDGDGVSDELEVSVGMDPADASDFFSDSDGDGVYDGEEVLDGTDLNDPTSFTEMLNRTIGEDGVLSHSLFMGEGFNTLTVDAGGQDSEGNVYLAGEIDGEDTTFYLAKWQSDWSLDSEFSMDGIIRGDDFGFGGASVFKVETDSANEPLLIVDDCNLETCLLSFDEAGELNSKVFSNQVQTGVFEFDLDSNYPKTLKLESGERYFAYGVSDFDRSVRVLKLTANEEIDSTFNNNLGYVDINISAGTPATEELLGIWLDNDGSILVGSYANTGASFGVYLIKMSADGTLNTQWGDQGVLEITTDSAYRAFQLIVDDEGGYWLHLSLNNGETEGVSVLRLTQSGERDASFAENGEFIFADHSGISYDRIGFNVQADGHIVALNAINRGLDAVGVMAFRLTPNGQLDSDFYNNGIARLSLDSNVQAISSFAFLLNHDILIAGPYDYSAESGVGLYMSVIPNESDMDGDGIEDFEDLVDDRFVDDEPLTPEEPIEDGDGDSNEDDLIVEDESSSNSSSNGGGAIPLFYIFVLLCLVGLRRMR